MATMYDLKTSTRRCGTKLTKMPQSVPQAYQARMGSNAPPVRIPKLKVRNRVDEVGSVSRGHTGDPSPLTSTSSNAESDTQPSTPSSGIHSPAPQRPNQTAKIFAINEAPSKKRSGLKGFLSTKEPSTAAFLKYAEQQQRAAALKGSNTGAMQQSMSQQKMPEYVPKVNAKWDGMPKVAHEPGNDQWKRSMDQDSLLSKMSKRSLSSRSAAPQSSQGSSTGRSRSSTNKSRGSSSSGSRTSSNRTSAERQQTARADAFALSRGPSNAHLVQQPRHRDEERDQATSTHHLELDGQLTRTPTSPSDAPSFSFDSYLAFSNQPPTLRETSSTETLKAANHRPGQSKDAADTANNAVTPPIRSKGEKSMKHVVESPQAPSTQKAQSQDNSDNESQETEEEKQQFAPHSPDDVFPESPHTQMPSAARQTQNIGITEGPAQSQQTAKPDHIASGNSQWPLPAPPTQEGSKERKLDLQASGPRSVQKRKSSNSRWDDDDLPPPVPVRAPSRNFSSPLRVATPGRVSTPKSPGQQSPASPPQSPSRSGSASPRSFSRPFSTGPLTPPTEKSSYPVPSTAKQPVSRDSVAGPAIRPVSFRSHAFNTSGGLRPPTSAIGRSVTKDSKLTPILESDAASQLSIPYSIRLDENEQRESHVLGDQAMAGLQEQMEDRVRSGDSDSDDDTHTEGYDSEVEADMSDAASIRSELSISWYQSPKQRLGLGGLIRHDTKGVPWPLEQEEDLDFVAGTGASSADIERQEKRQSILRRWRGGKSGA